MMNHIGSNHRNDAVSEIIGTVLLLAIALSMMTVVYFEVLTDDGPSPQTFIRIEGKVEGTNIIIEHMGGEPLNEDTWITMDLPDEEVKTQIKDFLVDDNNDGYWNIGERLKKPFEYNLTVLDQYTTSDIIAIDKISNSVVFMGPVSYNPVSDVSVTIDVDNHNPYINNNVRITINVTSLGGDVNGSGFVQVECKLPEGLHFQDSSATQGTYDNETGIWIVGNVIVGYPATLEINVKVIGVEIRPFTQYLVLLDGSGSISSDNWKIMTDGLASAIENENLPNDGSIELTVVQFGGYYNPNTRAELEISPTIITSSNYVSIANQIRNMDQLVNAYHQGGTPTGCAFYLGADAIVKSLNYSSVDKQIVTLVTDGLPTWCCDFDYDLYIADDSGYGCNEYGSSEFARDYMVDTLNLNEDFDEIDAIAIGDDLDVPWLRDDIVWPQPGNDTWPPSDPGWVRQVADEFEFANTIDEIFDLLFSGINTQVHYYSSTTIDLNDNNNYAKIIILPKDN